MNKFRIGKRWVGEGEPTFIVAEVSANHNQSYERAVKIIEAAKKSGANAIKIQTYTPDTLTIDSNREWFQIPSTSLWAGKTLYELYGEAYTPWDWQPKLQKVALNLGLDFFSTPFDSSAIDFLERLDVPVYKVASFEIVDLPLLKQIAHTGKPVIVSTGMASLPEIKECVETLRSNGTQDIALLKCTSAYPALPVEMNLRTINHLKMTFNTVVGLSDHTLGGTTAVGAVAQGACIVEKHFTLDRSEKGPDSEFSMQPEEFANMVNDIRHIEQALGCVSYELTKGEQNQRCFRRSLFVTRDLKKGEPFTNDNVRSIRPGYGLLPKHLEQILGRVAAMDVSRGTPLSWDLIDGTVQ